MSDKIFTQETLKDMKEVLVRGEWYLILKLNKTTVSTPNVNLITSRAQKKWAFKHPYAEIQDAR
jgi:hypothetical protein